MLKSYYRLRAQSGETYMYRQTPALMTYESDRSTTMFTKLCPWVINQLLLWLLVTGIQLDLMTAGLHEIISLVFR